MLLSMRSGMAIDTFYSALHQQKYVMSWFRGARVKFAM